MALPSGYTQLEYIRSSGTQYIDTGFTPNQNTRVVFDGFISAESGRSAYAFGVRTSGWSNALAAGATSGGVWQCGYANSSNSSSVAVGARCVVDVDRGLFKVSQNGTVLYENNFGSTSFTAPGNIYLFTLNNNGSIYNSASGQIYSFKIYDNGNLVRDFVPAKRNSDGVAGLYDTANGVFYTNAGSGTFTYPGYVEPVEGHNTLIGGTAYAVIGGKVMVGGTVYDIALGKTMVDGTVYDIAFGTGKITVNITGTGISSTRYVEIAGTKHSSAKTLEIEPGTEIKVVAAGYSSSMVTITLNGSKVGSTQYSFTPDCTEVTINVSYNSSTRKVTFTITTD